MGTKFSQVYNRFLGRITDDMYMELTPADTLKDLQYLIQDAISGFEFPRKNLTAYTVNTLQIDEDADLSEYCVIGEGEPGKVLVDDSSFTAELSDEEINILAILMMAGWLQRQITSIENIRMKYSGSDFKMTSQANHLSKLLTLLTEVQRQSHHLQRLYKRRKTDDSGNISSNWSIFGEASAID